MVRVPLPQLLAMYLELQSMLLALLDPPLLDQRRVWRIILNQPLNQLPHPPMLLVKMLLLETGSTAFSTA